MLTSVDPDALFCALVLAPHTYSRNRFYPLYDRPEARSARRRAARVRGIIHALSGSDPTRSGELLGERVLDDGRVLLKYRVGNLAFERTTALSPVEAATVRYALSLAGRMELSDDDRELVEGSLQRLAGQLTAEE